MEVAVNFLNRSYTLAKAIALNKKPEDLGELLHVIFVVLLNINTVETTHIAIPMLNCCIL